MENFGDILIWVGGAGIVLTLLIKVFLKKGPPKN